MRQRPMHGIVRAIHNEQGLMGDSMRRVFAALALTLLAGIGMQAQ
jgi:hypothetical protein